MKTWLNKDWEVGESSSWVYVDEVGLEYAYPRSYGPWIFLGPNLGDNTVDYQNTENAEIIQISGITELVLSGLKNHYIHSDYNVELEEWYEE